MYSSSIVAFSMVVTGAAGLFIGELIGRHSVNERTAAGFSEWYRWHLESLKPRERLDEYREFAELLIVKAPDFLYENPWVARWFHSLDACLTEICFLLGPDKDNIPVRPAPYWVLDCGWLKDGIQLCKTCHDKAGCGHGHDYIVADTGYCTLCEETNKVWKCWLDKLGEELGLDEKTINANGSNLASKREI
jgi:hypothetical protein